MLELDGFLCLRRDMTETARGGDGSSSSSETDWGVGAVGELRDWRDRPDGRALGVTGAGAGSPAEANVTLNDARG